MSLLKHINSLYFSKTEGLLKKAENFLNKVSFENEKFSETEDENFIGKVFFNFSKMCKELNLESSGILFQKDEVFNLLLSYNLEKENGKTCVSTKDFWDGTVSNYDWHIIKNDEVTHFYQLFSENVKENIVNLAIKKIKLDENRDFIFFAINIDSDITEIQDLENEIFKQKDDLEKFILLYSKIEEPISAKTFQNLVKNEMQMSPTLFFEIDFSAAKAHSFEFTENNLCVFAKFLQNDIKNLISEPNLVFLNKNKLKVINFCKYSAEPKVFEEKIKNDIKNLIGNECFNSLKFSSVEFTNVLDEVLYFALG